MKIRAIEITLLLYYDTLQLWYIRDYLAWMDEQDKKKREYWNGEGWVFRVEQVQEVVYAEERDRLRRKRKARKAAKAMQRYHDKVSKAAIAMRRYDAWKSYKEYWLYMEWVATMQ